MTATDSLVAEFLRLKRELVECCDDAPSEIEPLARSDSGFRELCSGLSWKASMLSDSHNRANAGIIAPVNETFIREWRDYEERMAGAVYRISLAHSLLNLPPPLVPPETWDAAYERAGIAFRTTDARRHVNSRAREIHEDINKLLRAARSWSLDEEDEEIASNGVDALLVK